MVPRKHSKQEPKEDFVLVRFTKRDHQRLVEAAGREKLEKSTWIRRLVLLELDALDEGVG